MWTLFKFRFQCILLLPLLSLAWADQPIACPLGYDKIDNYCFKLLNEALTFWEAVTACDVIDGKPVEIVTQMEQDQVKKYLQSATTTNVWMGATNLQGTWMYLSSKHKDALGEYTAWAPTFPKMKADPGHCLTLSLAQGWRWENVPCSYHQAALCEVRLSNTPIVGRR